MTNVVTLEPAATARLRARFRASVAAEPDAIDFVGAIDEAKAEMHRLSIDMGFMLAAGNTPGRGTVQRIETIASKLLQTAEAWRLAHELSNRT